jgi:ribonuclease HIII
MQQERNLMSAFEKFVSSIVEKFETLNLDSAKRKSINYGEQLTLLKGTQKVVLSIYNGKKGHKYVWGGSDCSLKKLAQQALDEFLSQAGESLSGSTTQITLLNNIPGFDYLWAGSDESGKGDFFGPLVVASVLVNKEIAQKLAALGVRDSKELTDKKILDLAKKIASFAPLHAVLALTPEIYNLRYKQLKSSGQNLNNLLANGHINALSQVLSKNPDCRFALVDRFTLHNNIGAELQKKFPYLTVVQQPKAEADMAVAAASILARAKFVEIMNSLSTMANKELPKGGGAQATACAQLIAETQGLAALDKLVKKHFANYKLVAKV